MGLLSVTSEMFPAVANPVVSPTMSRALGRIALSILQGALLGGVYGLALGRTDVNRFLGHLYAGPLAILVWIAARSLVEGHGLWLLVSPVGAVFIVIGGTVLGTFIWLGVRFRRADDAA